MFVGDAINLCSGHAADGAVKVTELEKRLAQAMVLLLNEMGRLIWAARLDPEQESQDYYAGRIRFYAVCPDNEVYKQFCQQYAASMEPLREGYSTRAALAVSELHDWCTEGII